MHDIQSQTKQNRNDENGYVISKKSIRNSLVCEQIGIEYNDNAEKKMMTDYIDKNKFYEN